MKNKQQEILGTASLLLSKEKIRKTAVECSSRNCWAPKKTFCDYYPDKVMTIKDIASGAQLRAEAYARTLSQISPNAASELVCFFEFIESCISVFTSVLRSDLLKSYPDANQFILESKSTKFQPFRFKMYSEVRRKSYRKPVDGKLTGELYFRQQWFKKVSDGSKPCSKS